MKLYIYLDVCIKQSIKYRNTDNSFFCLFFCFFCCCLLLSSCMAAAGILYIAIKYGDQTTVCAQNPLIGMVLGLLIIFNGQYYSQVVVGNTFRKVEEYSC